MYKRTYTKEQLVPELKATIEILDETKVQCREMLQLLDNLNAHMNTAESKVMHGRQQDYWTSNLFHVAEHLAVMSESVWQLESDKLNPNKKNIGKDIVTIIAQGKEFSLHLGDIYQQIIVSIAPIEAEIQREIEVEDLQC